MRHLESPFCHIKEVGNAKVPFTYVMYIFNTFIGNLMRIRVRSVEWTWLGLQWPRAIILAKRHASLSSSFFL